MYRLILAHVPADQAAAQQICTTNPGLGAVLVPVRETSGALSIGSTIQFGIVWSANAAGAAEARRLAEFAALSPLSTLVIRVDDTPLSDALASLRLVETSPDVNPQELSATLKMARSTAARRNPALTAAPVSTTPSPQLGAAQAAAIGVDGKPGYSRMFVSGMTRGLASSVAVLSLGGGITVGIQEQAGLLVTPSFASENAVESRAPLREGLLTSVEVAEQASALRRAAAAQRLDIDTRLTTVTQHLADVRTSTEEMMARLDAISVDEGFGVVEVVPGDAPAPAQVAAPVAADAPLADAQPAEDIYALTRYVDAPPSVEPLAEIEDDSGLELWSPT